MKLKGKMKFLGAEQGVSQQSGKPYYYLGLLQGMESERVYINEDLYRKVSSFQPFCDVDCELNIRIGDKTFVSLDSIQVIK